MGGLLATFVALSRYGYMLYIFDGPTNIYAVIDQVFQTFYNNYNKKHIDASVKERPQTLLVPSDEIYKRDLCNKHIYSNRQILIVRRENAFCKFHTFSGFVYHVSNVYHDLKHKIK